MRRRHARVQAVSRRAVFSIHTTKIWSRLDDDSFIFYLFFTIHLPPASKKRNQMKNTRAYLSVSHPTETVQVLASSSIDFFRLKDQRAGCTFWTVSVSSLLSRLIRSRANTTTWLFVCETMCERRRLWFPVDLAGQGTSSLVSSTTVHSLEFI